MTIDPKTRELAEHVMKNRLLTDHAGKQSPPTKEDIDDLAELIQQTIDDYVHDDLGEDT
jgi:hypothetical protein